MDSANKDGDNVHFRCSEAVITCQICMEIFESPRILPCQHTFCKKCVSSLLQRHCLDEHGNTKRSSFPCPNCRKECKIRKKGKHTLEEHLKCFPESLLLKTFLDSIDDTPNSELHEPSNEPGTGTEPLERVNDTYPHRKYGDGLYISSQTANVLEERLWLYCMFICKLHQFLRSVQAYYSSSLNMVRRSVFVILLGQLLEIPRIINNPVLYQNHQIEYFNVYDIHTSLVITNGLERNIRKVIEELRQNEDNDMECVLKDAQTQTEEECIAIRTFRRTGMLFQTFVSFLLLKNTAVVQCIAEYLLGPPDSGKIDCSLSYTIPNRRIRYWFLLIKLFDIFSLIYSVDQSISWSFLFLLLSYMFLLVFFKNIKTLIDGGIFIGNTLPLFPVFLISLNLFTNLNRCYIYYGAVLQLNFWFLLRVFLFELVPEILTFVFLMTITLILELSGKGHLMDQYGPYMDLNTVRP